MGIKRQIVVFDPAGHLFCLRSNLIGMGVLPLQFLPDAPRGQQWRQ